MAVTKKPSTNSGEWLRPEQNVVSYAAPSNRVNPKNPALIFQAPMEKNSFAVTEPTYSPRYYIY
jgi:hypothetical protein